MEKLNDVARHSVDGYGRQDICYNDPEGEFVFYSDYEKLEQDKDRLNAECIKYNDMALKYQQRAEAAEAALEVEKDIHDDTVQAMHLWCERAKEAEAKLAEMGIQKKACEVTDNYSRDGVNDEISVFLPVGTELFTRPAPAVDLAELVPDEITSGPVGWDGDESHCWVSGANWMRSAILRNIEEAK